MKLFLLFYFFFFFFSFFFFNSVAQNPLAESDQQVLNDMILSIPSLETQFSWTGTPRCTWTGVSCDGENPQHVIEIFLFPDNLTRTGGTLPNSIGNLTSLTYLIIADFNFTGEIPDSISNLVHLETLGIYDSALTGTIPNLQSSAESLTSLYFGANQLRGPLPDWLGNMYSLQYLDLSSNNFHGQIPSNFANLTNLATLYLENNSLEGNIEKIFSAVPLSTCDVSYNYFGCPRSFEVCCTNYVNETVSFLN